MRQLQVKATTGYGRKRYEPANDLAAQLAHLIQRDSKHAVTFTENDIERIKRLGYTVKVQAEVL